MRYSTAHRHEAASGLLRAQKRAAVGGLSKRIADVIIATLALVLLIPILIVTGVLIRLLLGTPIFAVEKSVGLGGKAFALLQFRTNQDGATTGKPWTEAVTKMLGEVGD